MEAYEEETANAVFELPAATPTVYRYSYEDILWHCSHVHASEEVIAIVREALRPGRIEKASTSRITGLLNKVTQTTFKKLLPDIISTVEQDRANGLKLLEHACLNNDVMSMYIKMLNYVTYKDQLATWFLSEFAPFVECLHKEMMELDQTEYDVFCRLQKKLRSLGARLRLLYMFADRGYLERDALQGVVEEASSTVDHIDMLLAFLAAIEKSRRPAQAVERLLQMGQTLSFKYKFKIEELMKPDKRPAAASRR